MPIALFVHVEKLADYSDVLGIIFCNAISSSHYSNCYSLVPLEQVEAFFITIVAIHDTSANLLISPSSQVLKL